MTLRDLEATFIRRTTTEYDGKQVEAIEEVQALQEADGIKFLCPKCWTNNKGNIGTHPVICWFEGKVPDNVDPKPGRWNYVGVSIEDLTFVPGKKSSSVLLLSGCAWHGFITDGNAVGGY